MKKINGFEKATVYTGESNQLPKGGYIVKIMDCKEIHGEKNGDSFSYLDFAYDVIEGEYKDHFKELYKNDSNEVKKWKGIYKAFIPQEGKQYYEENVNRFKTMIVNFEESNQGYHWDWDETKLKGKTIGVVYGEKEFETPQGDVIVITEPRYFTSAENVRTGKFKEPKFKKLQKSQDFTSDFKTLENDSDNELPF